MRAVLFFTVPVTVTSIVFAQSAIAPKTPRDESAYYAETQLRDIMQKSPASFSTRLFSDTTHSTAFIRLTKPDMPHAHGAWSELYVVKEGSGILETDGKITGITGTDSGVHKEIFTTTEGKQAPEARVGAVPSTVPGDLAGKAIEGGKRRAVKAGDLILIPAGVPHRWLQVTQPVTYLDIKFPKSEH